METSETTTTQPPRTIATFYVLDQFDGDYEVRVTDEPAIPTTTNERRFVVRVRHGVAESEWAEARDAMFRALRITGWDQL